LKEEGEEKHIPIVEIEGNVVSVKVGSVEHPMEESHYISMIQFFYKGQLVGERDLLPGEKPYAQFSILCYCDSGCYCNDVCNCTSQEGLEDSILECTCSEVMKESDYYARIYCNLHGLWISSDH